MVLEPPAGQHTQTRCPDALQDPHRGMQSQGQRNPFSESITVYNKTDKPIALVSTGQTPIVKRLLQSLNMEGKTDGGSFSLGLKPFIQERRCALQPINIGAKQAVYIGDSNAYLSAFVLVNGSPDLQQAHGVDVLVPCGKRVIIEGITMNAAAVELPASILAVGTGSRGLKRREWCAARCFQRHRMKSQTLAAAELWN